MQSGFTLVEVMTGLLFMVLLFVSVYLGLSQSFVMIQSARENLRATQIILQTMETIRLYSWDQMTNGSIPSTFTAAYDTADTQSTNRVFNGTVQISPAAMSESYSNDHRLVTVGLTWNSGMIQHQRQMTALVSRYGLHNYYY